MSADMTSQEDLEDVAFRALLAPLALEVLPGRSQSSPSTPANQAKTAPDKPAEDGPSSAAATPADCAAPDLEIPPGGGSTSSSPAPGHTAALAPGLPAENRSPQWVVTQSDPTPPGAGMLPEDWAPPVITEALDASDPELLPEDWPTLPEVASEFPAPPAAGDFVPLPPGMLPDGRWRLTVSLPGQYARIPAPDASPPGGSPRTTAESIAYRSPAMEGAARPGPGPRLVARAGAARDVAVQSGGPTQLVMRRPVLPAPRVRWSVVLLAGIASALTVAYLSWLSNTPAPDDVPIEPGVAARSDVRPAVPAIARPAAGPMSSEPRAQSRASAQASPSVPASESGAPSAATPAQSAQAMIGLLTQRGDAALAVGDIIAARLLYERAASMGSPTAATAAGKTYDIDFLVRADTHGIRPDPSAAAAWYRKAVALGDSSARTLLARLEAQSRQ